MITLLQALSGVAWTIVYIEAIRLGLRHRTYAIPLVALALNIAWEVLYAAHKWTEGVSAQGVINTVWAAADLVIVYTYLRFGRRELGQWISRSVFGALSALVFATGMIVQWLFPVEFDWSPAARYSAFLSNLLMSGLFIAMFAARRGPRGQSLTIAAAKWVGTALATVVYGVLEDSAFILSLGVLCFIFDLVYVGLLAWARRNPQAFTVADHASADTALEPIDRSGLKSLTAAQ